MFHIFSEEEYNNHNNKNSINNNNNNFQEQDYKEKINWYLLKMSPDGKYQQN